MAYCRCTATNTLADELADDNTLKLRFNKDGKTAYATYVITEKSGEKYLIFNTSQFTGTLRKRRL